MQLDDMQRVWAAHAALLEKGLAIEERLLRELELGRVRRALAPYVRWRALEVALGLAALSVVLPILREHAGEPRYLVTAGTLAAYALGVTALCATLLVAALRLDYGGPVTAIQRDVERLRRTEYRALKWALLGGVLVWLPAALVAFERLTGVDALGRVDRGWLAGNLVFGLLVLVLGQALSRRYVERPTLGPRARRVLDAVSGRGLRAAASHLDELAAFTRDEPPAREA